MYIYIFFVSTRKTLFLLLSKNAPQCRNVHTIHLIYFTFIYLFFSFVLFKPTSNKYDGKLRLSMPVVCFNYTGLISPLDSTCTQLAVVQRGYGPSPTVLVASRPRNKNYFGFVYFRTDFVRRRNGCGSCPGSPPLKFRFYYNITYTADTTFLRFRYFLFSCSRCTDLEQNKIKKNNGAKKTSVPQKSVLSRSSDRLGALRPIVRGNSRFHIYLFIRVFVRHEIPHIFHIRYYYVNR